MAEASAGGRRRHPPDAAAPARASILACAAAVASFGALEISFGASCARPAATASDRRALDDFEDLTAWTALASDGARASIHAADGADGEALRLDFGFEGAGYAIARRALPMTWPANFELSFQLRADAPVNNLEIKLVDASGDNVWWFHRRDFAFPTAWQRVTVKRRQIEFAWGPTEDRALARTAALELVVSAGRDGGAGSVYFDQLALRELPPPPATPPDPAAAASSSAPGAGPGLALDGRRDTAWTTAPGAGAPHTLTLDLGYARELGGLVLRWQPGAHASRYSVEASDDGVAWRTLREVTRGDGGRDALRLPETETRFLRLALHEGPGAGFGLAEVEIQGLAFGSDPNAMFAVLAADSPRGRYPRGMSGEQAYWTLVGIDGGGETGLLSEDGALEIARGGASIEPFIVSGSREVSGSRGASGSRGVSGSHVTTWADVEITHALDDGYLPVPTVTWRAPAWELRVTALAAGAPAASRLIAEYALTNRTDDELSVGLVLGVRPFQVNPPSQTLNLPGGVSPIHALDWDGGALSINGASTIHPLAPPDHVALAAFDAGGFPESPPPRGGNAARAITDDTGLASAALAYDLRVAAGATATVGVVVPLSGDAARPNLDGVSAAAWLDRERRAVADTWREALDRVAFRVPPQGQPLIDTLRSSLAHMLMTRDGAVLRPGTRSYARSWIRDGAMMSEALLRLGHEAIAADYLRWYAPHQFDSGKVPCCVDARGADPVPENDSAGELIFLAAEVYRYTADRDLLAAMWPHIEAAARYLEALRQSERTPANLAPARRPYYGLLPPSISHEGYSDKPAYSYWDAFWGLKGYKDATAIAAALGHAGAEARLARQRDELRDDLYASLRASAQAHQISYLPGAADRGDFDPTSTTIALSPGGEGHALPRDLLLPTFERYWQEFLARRDGARDWTVYTPYELRVVSTFLRLGWRARAAELLAFFLADRRPAGWNQWAEVVSRERRAPRFLGDMPHAWISSDYIRAVLDMFAYEREVDQSLVLAAGVPPDWLDGQGVAVKGLRTAHGPLSYTLSRKGDRVVLVVASLAAPGDGPAASPDVYGPAASPVIDGPAASPPGGFVFPWPWDRAPGPARVNGAPARWRDGALTFPAAPAAITIELANDQD